MAEYLDQCFPVWDPYPGGQFKNGLFQSLICMYYIVSIGVLESLDWGMA